MKKLFAILLSMLLTVSMICVFTACDSNEVGEEVSTGDVVVEETSDEIHFDKNVIIDTEHFCFCVDSAELNETEETWSVKVIMENKTDKVLTFNWKEVFVNDVAVDPGWASEVAEGESDNGTVIFPLSLLAENDITDVENIKFTLSVTDAKGNIVEDTEYIFSLVVTDEEETTVVEEETTIDETTTVAE